MGTLTAKIIDSSLTFLTVKDRQLIEEEILYSYDEPLN